MEILTLADYLGMLGSRGLGWCNFLACCCSDKKDKQGKQLLSTVEEATCNVVTSSNVGRTAAQHHTEVAWKWLRSGKVAFEWQGGLEVAYEGKVAFEWQGGLEVAYEWQGGL